MSQSLPSTTLVIFGVTGDLAKRKLLPALAEICQNSEIRTHLNILGLSRRQIEADTILPKTAKNLRNQFSLLRMDYALEQDYSKLKDVLNQLGSQQIIFYFAVPPEAVLPIVGYLGRTKLNQSKHRLLMEKPFGVDLTTAKKLISQTDRYFKEDQVYRIDHFLAKEMAQNITVFLGSNALFRDVWNNQFIEKIEVVAEESLGIENRGEFYEQTGALRDIIQSHLLQLTALTIMEPCPDVFDFSMVRGRRLAALRKLEVDKTKPVAKAQYTGYGKEVNNSSSTTETFASVYLKSSDPKWHGVPIQLTTGKALAEKLTEIRIFFKKTRSAQTNLLKLRVQPKEAIELELWIKKPGYEEELQKLPLDFSYAQYFDRLPDAYEQVIVDAVRSRANLFASSDEVIASWQILQPLLKAWDKLKPKTYEPGSTVEQVIKNVYNR
jgi:glucose-6-phosphate 1-dehydrogenase